MSNLKTIIVELENCVRNDSYSPDIPSVWSRDFHIKLGQATDHWKIVQNRKSHVRDMDFQDEEDGNISLPYDDKNVLTKGEFEVNNYEEEETGSTCTYGDAYRKHTGSASTSKSLYGDAYRNFTQSRSNEEEETNAKAGFSTTGMRGEDKDDCKVCYGTGMDFPRLKGDCEACGGSGKVKEEQAEEDAMQQGRPAAYQQQQAQGNPDEQSSENIAVDDQYGLDDPNDGDVDGVETGTAPIDKQEWDDPDYQGAVRTVPSAHLVYKRQLEDGTFDELWQYNLGDDFKKELKIRRAIIAGTDIPINKMRSPDNTQSYELWTIGNGQMLKVKGLPN